MNIKGSTPPVPSKTKNPLQGSSQHKVITLGIQDEVKEGLDAGTGVNALAKTLNATILKDSKVKISGMGILRWADKYYSEGQRETTEHAVNLYSHYVEMLNQISKQMDVQSVCIHDLSKKSEESVDDIMNTSKALNASMLTWEKLGARKIVLLQTLGSIQEKVYGYIAASEVVDITMKAVKDKDAELYSEIKAILSTNAEYMELFRKIQPEK